MPVILSMSVPQAKSEAKALISSWQKLFYIAAVFCLTLSGCSQASANQSEEGLYAKAVEAWTIAVSLENDDAITLKEKINLLTIAENALTKIINNYPNSDLTDSIISQKNSYQMPIISGSPMEQEVASTIRLSDVIQEKHSSFMALHIENCIAHSTVKCLIFVATQLIIDNNQSRKTKPILRCIAAHLATTGVADDTIAMSRQISSQYDRFAVLYLISVAFAEAGYVPIALEIARQIDNGHVQADAIGDINGGVRIYLDRKEGCP